MLADQGFSTSFEEGVWYVDFCLTMIYCVIPPDSKSNEDTLAPKCFLKRRFTNHFFDAIHHEMTRINVRIKYLGCY
jgi:hypothetical protein